MKNIVIIGSGFAGMWSALSAARVCEINQAKDIKITVLAPSANLEVRPRFYEENVEQMKAPLSDLYQVMGIDFIASSVESIKPEEKKIKYLQDGQEAWLNYDRLILASGSFIRSASIQGAQFAFDVDQIESAKKLEKHLDQLALAKPSKARNTVVVCGGGLTGIEVATELPERLKSRFGKDEKIEVIVVDQGKKVAANFSEPLSQVIEKASQDLDVTWKTGVLVESVHADHLVLNNGERIETQTVILTAGVQASALTTQVNSPLDPKSRLYVDPYLQVQDQLEIYATGDVAAAKCDDEGRLALMTCQHAIPMGKFAGHNAAMSLINKEERLPYKQENYVTCVDLGAWGAVYTETWSQEVKMVESEAKALKKSITTELIYPPKADKAEVMQQADPLAFFV